MPLDSISGGLISPNNYEFRCDGSTKWGKVRVGGGASVFVPKLTFGAWDECQIELTLDANVTGQIRKSLVENADGSIEVGNGNFSFWYLPVGIRPGFNDEGGLDFILTLKKKPPVNVLPFLFNQVGVVAGLQPSLATQFSLGWNDEFQDEIVHVSETQVIGASGTIWVHCPEYVPNSIAFYHSSRAGEFTDRNYRTGKIGHLYRMKATDAAGKWTWADWSLDGNSIKLTCSPEFLDGATYPVIVAPAGDTFGFTAVAAVEEALLQNTMRVLYGTQPSSAGVVTTIHVHGDSSSGNAVYFRPIMYQTVANGGARMTYGAGQEVTSTTAAWLNMDVTGVAIASGTEYWPGVWLGGANYPDLMYDNLSSAGLHRMSQAYSGEDVPPDTWSTGSTLADRRWSIYATYTTGWATITKVLGGSSANITKVLGGAV